MRSVARYCRSCVMLPLLLAACTMPAPPEDGDPPPLEPAAVDSVRDQVLAAVEQYYADLSDRDWRRFADHFWPGATLTTRWQPPGEPSERIVTSTVESFVRQAPLGPGSREIFEERMTSAHVRADGDLAQVWARYHAMFGDPGEIEEWDGIDAFTLIRFQGRWRIASLAYMATDSVPG